MSYHIMTHYGRVGGLVLAKIPERDSLLLITYTMYKLWEKASPLLAVPCLVTQTSSFVSVPRRSQRVFHSLSDLIKLKHWAFIMWSKVVFLVGSGAQDWLIVWEVEGLLSEPSFRVTSLFPHGCWNIWTLCEHVAICAYQILQTLKYCSSSTRHRCFRSFQSLV